MGLFDRLNQGPAADQPYELLEGGFGCQRCNEQVDEAKWYFAMKLLIWECSQGHKSTVEGFQL